jgi:chemotaxis protein methyltransferase WspC
MAGRFEHTDAERSIAVMLNQLIGLNETSIGSAGVQRAIAQAMRASGYRHIDDYWQQLQVSQAAVAALIEAIVVPETSFFRNPESFLFLQRWAAQMLPLRDSEFPLRLLSLPCSTGEEPYSIAMTLFEAGLSAEQFQIDAVDISEAALTQARRGLFNAYSFRQGQSLTTNPEVITNRYFQLQEDRYRLVDRVRSQVHFLSGNLAGPLCLYGAEPYDVVFCRNLLIYFHETARDRALQTLHRLLKPDGLLFVGYAETSQIQPQQFALLRCPQAFVYRRAETVSETPVTPAIAAATLSSPRLSMPPGEVKAASANTDAAVPMPLAAARDPVISPASVRPPVKHHSLMPPTVPAVASLEEIRVLADQGDLASAATQCDRYLHNHPTSAAAYRLLGEIYQAQGIEKAAITAFRKAIYLDPTCVEVLLCLALLYEHQGQIGAAQRLRQRVQRLTHKE